jgi:hypothetical protein
MFGGGFCAELNPFFEDLCGVMPNASERANLLETNVFLGAARRAVSGSSWANQIPTQGTC